MGQGPTPMALGPFAFRSLGFSYKDISRQLDTGWAEIEVAQRMNALQWTGPKSDKATIKGVLFPEEWGGLGALEGIRAAAQAGLPLMLVSGSGSIFGLHVVLGVSEDRSSHDAHGRPRRDAYQINLQKYEAGAGSGAGSGVAGGIQALLSLI